MTIFKVSPISHTLVIESDEDREGLGHDGPREIIGDLHRVHVVLVLRGPKRLKSTSFMGRLISSSGILAGLSGQTETKVSRSLTTHHS